MIFFLTHMLYSRTLCHKQNAIVEVNEGMFATENMLNLSSDRQTAVIRPPDTVALNVVYSL